jgi:hypothetical protein
MHREWNSAQPVTELRRPKQRIVNATALCLPAMKEKSGTNRNPILHREFIEAFHKGARCWSQEQPPF